VIQRAWRRYRARSAGRQQRRAILHTREREKAEIEQEQRLHSIRIVQAALRTRIAQAQLKQSLARATALKAAARKIWTWWQWRAKIRQWHRRWQQTARASSLLYQKLSRQQIASIVLLQSAMRSYLARKHVVAWKVQMHRHRVRKQRAREWARKQMRSWKEVPLEESLVLSELYTHKEVAHTRREQQVERSLLSKKFSSWESSMQRYFLQKRPLPKHWLPQTDRHSGRTYYFNLKTGESRQDHPLHQAVEELRKKQQLQAERTLAERVATLREYEQRLQAGLTAQRAAKLEQLAQAKRLQ
jgi:hypothetical protein